MPAFKILEREGGLLVYIYLFLQFSFLLLWLRRGLEAFTDSMRKDWLQPVAGKRGQIGDKKKND